MLLLWKRKSRKPKYENPLGVEKEIVKENAQSHRPCQSLFVLLLGFRLSVRCSSAGGGINNDCVVVKTPGKIGIKRPPVSRETCPSGDSKLQRCVLPENSTPKDVMKLRRR
jgi:hypothetical protein